ncbi:hypothetical protein O181_051899 [Austropuccinia psidii MF-1]|uniref:Uncharacterized protein n=1 Tax=Austropuccinia psidii MF-1 TaxID=1389203 RepID=A0A9Q3HR56_9BASI|nr:hypothetical protein [Austropuccinia psidii MF-1]
MEHGQQEGQPSITLGRMWRKLPEDMSQRDTLQRPYGNNQRMEYHQEVKTPGGEGNQDKRESSHYPSDRRTAEPDRAYSDSFRLIRSRPTQLSSGFTPFGNQKISGEESPFFTISGSFKEKTRIQWKKQDIFQPKAERVRPNDPEAVGFDERSTQEPEIVVNTFRISSPNNRNNTPTQNEHSFVTHESSLTADALWLQMSQFLESTQKKFSELQESHERMKTLTASMEKIVKTLQEGHAQLSKASEETNERLNQVSEEQKNCKRDRDCLDQDLNKLFNFYQNMKPQPQGHVVDNPYHQEDIKPDVLLENKTRSPSQYQDEDNMYYSEKEALKQLPEASSWPKFSRTGEYYHVNLIDYNYGFSIDVRSIPYYQITSRLNKEFKGHATIWYTEMKEIHVRRSWPWWESQIIQKYSNDYYANNCPKEKKKSYAIEQVPEEESPTEDYDSDFMGDAIREQFDEEQDPREEFLVEYQEETPLEVQDIHLEARMPQDTANRNLCKHTQDALTFLVTPTKGMAYIN